MERYQRVLAERVISKFDSSVPVPPATPEELADMQREFNSNVIKVFDTSEISRKDNRISYSSESIMSDGIASALFWRKQEGTASERAWRPMGGFRAWGEIVGLHFDSLHGNLVSMACHQQERDFFLHFENARAAKSFAREWGALRKQGRIPHIPMYSGGGRAMHEGKLTTVAQVVVNLFR